MSDGSVKIDVSLDTQNFVKEINNMSSVAKTGLDKLNDAVASGVAKIEALENKQAELTKQVENAKQSLTDQAAALETARGKVTESTDALSKYESLLKDNEKTLSAQKNILADSAKETETLKIRYEVIRIQKRQNNFVMMDKGFLENVNLSWKAKGILAYLLSKPDNWKVIVRDLMNHATDGKTAIYSGLKELNQQGYYEKTPVRSEDGRRISHWEGTISEVPMESLVNTEYSLLPGFLEIENQDIDNQDLENRERNNNYLSNTDLNNNQSSPVRDDRQGGTDDIESLKELVHENIGYEVLMVDYKYDQGLINEIVAVILDVLATKSETIRICQENKPRSLVNHMLMDLELLRYRTRPKPV